MEKEFSAGAIIFKKEKEMALFLLLYSSRNKIWSFPKGHLEAGEAEKDAMLREIREETGVTDLKFIDGFREEDIYEAKSNRGPNAGRIIEKHSIYFLVETNATNVSVEHKEITDYKWLNIHEALKLLAFDSLKRLLRKAKVFAHINIPRNAK